MFFIIAMLNLSKIVLRYLIGIAMMPIYVVPVTPDNLTLQSIFRLSCFCILVKILSPKVTTEVYCGCR